MYVWYGLIAFQSRNVWRKRFSLVLSFSRRLKQNLVRVSDVVVDR